MEGSETNHDLDDDGFIFGGTTAGYLKGLVSRNINFAALWHNEKSLAEGTAVRPFSRWLFKIKITFYRSVETSLFRSQQQYTHTLPNLSTDAHINWTNWKYHIYQIIEKIPQTVMDCNGLT